MQGRTGICLCTWRLHAVRMVVDIGQASLALPDNMYSRDHSPLVHKMSFVISAK